MNIKNQLKKLIKDSLASDIDLDLIEIEIPKDKDHGDYSSNVALKLTKVLNKLPIDIAEAIKNNISYEIIEQIDIAGPGFINFYLKKDYLFENIKTVLSEEDNYGRSNIGNNKKINVEFVSVNPTGIIHLGHARGACYGDSLSNILEFVGYQVTREYYVNDAGCQMDNMAKSIKERYKELCGFESIMERDYYYGHEIIDVAKIIYDEYKDSYLGEPIESYKKMGLDYFLKQIKLDLSDAGIEFNVFTSEQEIRDKGLVEKSIAKLNELGYTYTLDGAIWLKTSEFNDEKDRVIIKKDQDYTYLLPDIAYHLDKLDRGYDYLIDVLGADHHGYVPRLKAAVTMLGKDPNKLECQIVQMVRAIKDKKEYKLSKRTGKTITMRDLLSDVGKDGVRYFFIARSLDTQMDFDIDLATKKSNENPVYYVQYAHARICSILKNYELNLIENSYLFDTISSDSAYNVLAKIYEFKETVEKSALRKEPHIITNYIYDLANLFHSYYSSEKIISDNEKYTKDRLYLIKAVKITIANALKLVGVSSPTSM